MIGMIKMIRMKNKETKIYVGIKFILMLFVLVIVITKATNAQEKPHILAISHIAVKATDVEKSVAFYRDFLGYQEQLRLHYQDDGTLELVVMKVSDEQWIEIFTNQKRNLKDSSLYQIAFRYEDDEVLRTYLKSNGFNMPDKIGLGQMKNFGFTIRDPNGYIIEFQQYRKEGRLMSEHGQFLSDKRISDHIFNASIVSNDYDKSKHFYTDILGLTNGTSENQFQIPDSKDGITFLNAGGTTHFSLAVTDIKKAKAQLKASAYLSEYSKSIDITKGKDGRKRIILTDPEGVQLELVEMK